MFDSENFIQMQDKTKNKNIYKICNLYCVIYSLCYVILLPNLQTKVIKPKDYLSDCSSKWHYFASRWIGGISGCLCLILYLPGIFTEKYIAAKELEYKKTHKEAQAAAEQVEAASADVKVKHRFKFCNCSCKNIKNIEC